MPRREIARAQLSDGSVYLERMGRRTYLVTRTYSAWLTEPDGAYGLTLTDARRLFTDFVDADLFEREI